MQLFIMIPRVSFKKDMSLILKSRVTNFCDIEMLRVEFVFSMFSLSKTSAFINGVKFV